MNIRPTGDRVLIQRSKADDVTAGGIIIPDNAKEKPARGKVLAVGPGRVTEAGVRIEPFVKTGDEVLFGKYSGTELKQLDEQIIISEGDILGVIEG